MSKWCNRSALHPSQEVSTISSRYLEHCASWRAVVSYFSHCQLFPSSFHKHLWWCYSLHRHGTGDSWNETQSYDTVLQLHPAEWHKTGLVRCLCLKQLLNLGGDEQNLVIDFVVLTLCTHVSKKSWSLQQRKGLKLTNDFWLLNVDFAVIIHTQNCVLQPHSEAASA